MEVTLKEGTKVKLRCSCTHSWFEDTAHGVAIMPTQYTGELSYVCPQCGYHPWLTPEDTGIKVYQRVYGDWVK
jgi:hypothetical protein